MRLCANADKAKLLLAYDKLNRILSVIPSSAPEADEIWMDAYNIIFDEGGIRDVVWEYFPDWEYLNIDGSYRDDVYDFKKSLDDLMREVVYY